MAASNVAMGGSYSKKPGGRDSACNACRKQAQVSRRKKLRANKHMVIDGENLVIESELVGDPSQRSCGGRIRTADLRVMSPTRYQTSPPRGIGAG